MAGGIEGELRDDLDLEASGFGGGQLFRQRLHQLLMERCSDALPDNRRSRSA